MESCRVGCLPEVDTFALGSRGCGQLPLHVLMRHSTLPCCNRAGNPPHYYSGVCRQDSGGPLFLPSPRRGVKDMLYGVVSNGNGKCIGAPGDKPRAQNERSEAWLAHGDEVWLQC